MGSGRPLAVPRLTSLPSQGEREGGPGSCSPEREEMRQKTRGAPWVDGGGDGKPMEVIDSYNVASFDGKYLGTVSYGYGNQFFCANFRNSNLRPQDPHPKALGRGEDILQLGARLSSTMACKFCNLPLPPRPPALNWANSTVTSADGSFCPGAAALHSLQQCRRIRRTGRRGPLADERLPLRRAAVDPSPRRRFVGRAAAPSPNRGDRRPIPTPPPLRRASVALFAAPDVEFQFAVYPVNVGIPMDVEFKHTS